jgi:hypothetical protein
MLEQGQRTIPDPIVDDEKLKSDLRSLEPQTINLPEEDLESHQSAATIEL